MLWNNHQHSEIQVCHTPMAPGIKLSFQSLVKGVGLISEEIMFQKVDTMAEKTFLLGFTHLIFVWSTEPFQTYHQIVLGDCA